MRARSILTAAAAALLAVPATASAGIVTRTADAITYDATPGTTQVETVTLGSSAGAAYVESNLGVTSADCAPSVPERVDCLPAAKFVIHLLAGGDGLTTNDVLDTTSVEAFGGGGIDSLGGTPNADTLNGEAGGDYLSGEAGADTLNGGDDSDNIDGGAGSDVIDAGAGSENYLNDGPDDDTVTGGPGNDSLVSGLGRDVFNGGVGSDRVDYSARLAPVTVTLNGVADDGEAGEGDNIGADVEEAIGGVGNDTLVGNLAGLLAGGPGNDSIKSGPGGARVEGGDGDDTIDTRNGVYDSIDCGIGTDTVLADIDDSTTNCELAPDADGDGSLADTDCAPLDPAIHPGAGEIFGNDVDEDCDNLKGYERVIPSFTLAVDGQVPIRFTTFLVRELRAGDVVRVTCKGKACPFKKTKSPKVSGDTANVKKLFKGKGLRKVTIEIRVLRENFIGAVQRYKISKKGKITPVKLCLPPGAASPTTCP